MGAGAWCIRILAVGLVAALPTVAAQALEVDATPLQMAKAMEAQPGLVTGAYWKTFPPGPSTIPGYPPGGKPCVAKEGSSVRDEATPHALVRKGVTGFPIDGPSFAALTTGDAGAILGPNDRGCTSTYNAGVARGAADVVILAVQVRVPPAHNCLGFGARFLSEEFPEYVGSRFKDAFLAEIDNNTWRVRSSLSAPHNIAFTQTGQPIDIDQKGMAKDHAQGTTYDGASLALDVQATVTPGAHTLYLSIYDFGDANFDSAVFLDGLVTRTVADPSECRPGARPMKVQPTPKPEPPQPTSPAMTTDPPPPAEATTASPPPSQPPVPAKPVPTVPSPWPTERGGPARTGRHADSEDCAHAPWTTWVGNPDPGPPVVVDCKLLLGSGANLQARNATDGSLLWQRALDGAVSGSPALGRQYVYATTQAGSLYAYQTETGFLAWQATGPPGPTGPVFADGLVFFGTRTGTLHALEEGSGAQRWRHVAGGSLPSAPTVAGSEVLFGNELHGTVSSVHAKAGVAVWDPVDTVPGPISGVLAAPGRYYVGSADGSLVALDAHDTGFLWAYNAKGAAHTPALAGGLLVFGSDDRSVRAVYASNGSLAWVVETGGPVIGIPALSEGRAYVGSTDGAVYAINLTSGGVEWAVRTGGPVAASPAVAGGMVYVASRDGHLYAIDAATGDHVPAPRPLPAGPAPLETREASATDPPIPQATGAPPPPAEDQAPATPAPVAAEPVLGAAAPSRWWLWAVAASGVAAATGLAILFAARKRQGNTPKDG